MTTVTRSRHARLLSVRVAGLSIAVLAMLLYLNLAQLDDESHATLYASEFFSPTIDRVLADRREAAANALYEYCLLVVAGIGVLGALAGPAVIRRIARS